MQRQARHRRAPNQDYKQEAHANTEKTNRTSDQASHQTGTGPDGAVYGIIERPGLEKAFWSRIGDAFKNKDGSINLKLDFLPRDSATGMQVRWLEHEAEAEQR